MRRPGRPGRGAGGSERGAIAVIMMLVLTIFMGFAALGFDLSYVRLARFEMKNAMDAATHAAMYTLRFRKDSTLAQQAAIDMAGRNTVLGHAVVLAQADVTFGDWNWDTSTFTTSANVNAVQIVGHKADPSWADGSVPTTLGNFFGVTSATISQTGAGAFRPRTTMLELDVTGSFITVSCGIQNAIDADVAFLDDMIAAKVTKDRLGMDVFVGEATAVSPIDYLATAGASMRSLWVGDGVSAKTYPKASGVSICTKTGLAGVTSGNASCGNGNPWPNMANISGSIVNPYCWAGDSHYDMVNGPFGGTNPGAAIKAALDKIKLTSKTYDVRSIIVFTDGGPMCCEQKNGGSDCGTNANGGNPCCADGTTPGPCLDNIGGKACTCASQVYQYGLDQADDAYNNYGVDVYTLSFTNGTHPNWITYAKSLVRGRGFEVDTTDKTQLTAKLKQIADAIPISLVK